MKITITGEHEDKTITIAVLTIDDVTKDTKIEDGLMDAIKTQIAHYIKNYVK